MNIADIKDLTDEQIELVNKLVQSETDKVRTDYSTKLKAVNDELTQYKPRQKTDTEIALEERVKAIEDREKELSAKERAIQIGDKLKAKGIPAELGKYLNVGEDIDGDIEKVGAALGSYFLGQGDKPSNHSTNKGVTRDDFARMSYAERVRLFKEDNDLYKALSK